MLLVRVVMVMVLTGVVMAMVLVMVLAGVVTLGGGV